MLNALVNSQANHVNQHIPIYYRLPRSKLYVRTYYAIFTVGMISTAYGGSSSSG
ncbi:hypothetical protein C8T65DRAFT_629264, partial [Cerioporus squamosus]